MIGSLLLLMVQRTAARLEAAVILPHGDFALDPTLLPPGTAARKAAEAIAKGAASVGMWFGDKSGPDLTYGERAKSRMSRRPNSK